LKELKIQKNIGYKMSALHEYRFFDNLSEHTEEIFNIAYMNDTTWLANCRNSLAKQLEIADSFNKLNNIQVNPTKAELIVINPPINNPSITYGEDTHEIKALASNQSNRFFGSMGIC
jgi:hypothetical protein